MVKEKLLNVVNVAEKLNCSRQHVYRLIRDGKLAGVKIGFRTRGLRIPESAFNKFISDGQIAPMEYDA